MFDVPLEHPLAGEIVEMIKSDYGAALALEKQFLNEYIEKVNIPAIPIVGTFRYDMLKDQATIDHNQKRIIGLEKDVVSFVDVFQCIDDKSKDQFQEQVGTWKTKNVFSTDNIQLTNGHVIEEIYKFDFHPDDYERKSLLFITGQTKLLRVA